MKKLTAILLTLSLMLTMLCAPALAEEEPNTFVNETVILGPMGLTADDWMATPNARAVLAGCLPFDLYFAFGEDSEVYQTVVASMDNGEIFVGRDDSMLLIFCFLGDKQAIGYFFPSTGALGYSLDEISASVDPDAMMQYYVAGDILSEYYAVPGEDILDFLKGME